jgi:hypothetical protein
MALYGPIDYAKIAQKLREELVSKGFKKELDNVTVAAGGSVDVDVATDGLYSGMLVTCRAKYDPAATAGVRVRCLYGFDGVNFDTPEDADAEGNYFEPSFSAGATRQRSVIFPLLTPYVRIRVTNLDTARPVTISLWRSLTK